MKISLKEIRQMVYQIISEAKKKKEKKSDPRPDGYAYLEAMDFSSPLGAYNLYKSQGSVNWGPYTGAGTKIDDRVTGARGALEEAALRQFIREMISEAIGSDRSAWKDITEKTELSNGRKFKNIWEAALHWYDHQKLGLGHQTQEGLAAKKKSLAKKGKE
jgi:hypothetical protein